MGSGVQELEDRYGILPHFELNHRTECSEMCEASMLKQQNPFQMVQAICDEKLKQLPHYQESLAPSILGSQTGLFGLGRVVFLVSISKRHTRRTEPLR